MSSARQAQAAERLADDLEGRTLGSLVPIYDRRTTLEWHFDAAQVVGYDFAKADRSLLPLLYDLGFSALQACVTGEQNLDTYTSTEYARYILENVRLVMLGGQQADAAERLAEIYRDRLPPAALQSLRTLAPGEFVMLLGDEAHLVSVQLTDLEEQCFLPCTAASRCAGHRDGGGHHRAEAASRAERDLGQLRGPT